jgi:sulfate permease, SulP family
MAGETIPSLAGSGLAVSWPWVWGLVALGLVIIYQLPRLTRVVPSTLVAILVISGLAEWWQLPVPRVGDLGRLPTNLPVFQIPEVFSSFDTLGIILPTALAISFVGLLQSFLTANVVEDMLDQEANYEAEARAEGIANITAGLFGGMAGAGMIGQSVINLESGGRYRLSTLTAGIGLLILVISLSSWLARIPMAALVAVMIMVSVSTVNWDSLLKITKVPKSDTAVMLLTLVLALLTRNLAIAVLVGVALAGILFSRKVAKVIAVTATWQGGRLDLLQGAGTAVFCEHGVLSGRIQTTCASSSSHHRYGGSPRVGSVGHARPRPGDPQVAPGGISRGPDQSQCREPESLPPHQ